CFLFHDTPPTVIYTLSLHDALPIWQAERSRAYPVPPQPQRAGGGQQAVQAAAQASPPPRRPFTPADSGVINSFKVCSDVQCRTSDRKSTRLNSSHLVISYAVFCLKK